MGVAEMSRVNLGRYSRVNDAQHPGPELPRDRPGARVRVAAVADPMPDPDRKRPGRQKVAVNIHTDVLETEYAYGRISTGAYQAGRTYQFVLEIARGRTSGGPTFEPKDRGNPAIAHEYAIVAGLERAREAVDLIDDTREALGPWTEELLTDVLGEKAMTLTRAAEARGFLSRDGRRKVARLFRQALEDIADYWDKSRAPRRAS